MQHLTSLQGTQERKCANLCRRKSLMNFGPGGKQRAASRDHVIHQRQPQASPREIAH